MSIFNLKDLLSDGKEKKYGILATNAFNFDSAQAIIRAAEEKKSPVILMAAEGLFKYFNFEKLAGPMLSLAKEASIPVALNLDHGYSLRTIKEAIEVGFTSVMFDGSNLTLDENINKIKQVVKVSHPMKISVEGEVGLVKGLEEENSSSDMEVNENCFTRVVDAIRFVKETDIDALAVSVGTIHGLFKDKPNIDFERISRIGEAVKIPLVLHGGSGLSDDDYKKVVECGITKINYFTGLLTAARKEMVKIIKNDRDINYMEVNYNAMLAFKKEIMKKMDVFGSTGKG